MFYDVNFKGNCFYGVLNAEVGSSLVLNSLNHLTFLLPGCFCGAHWESFPCLLCSSARGTDDARRGSGLP